MNAHVKAVAALLPFTVTLFADMSGPSMLQIDLGRRGQEDDPPDSASIDPTSIPAVWIFDVEGGRETVASSHGLETDPMHVARWIVDQARLRDSPSARKYLSGS